MSRPSLLAAGLVLCAGLTACSSSAGQPTPAAQKPASEGAAAAAEPATAVIPPAPQRVAAIRKQLLTAGEVAGMGAPKGGAYGYELDRPCLKKPAMEAFPGHEQVESELAGHGFLEESVAIFGDAPTAAEAYAAHVAELACPGGIVREGEDEVLPVTIGVPQQVREVVGGDQATTWLLTSAPKAERARVVVVIALVKDMVVDLVFSSANEAAGLKEPLAAARTAITKLSRA
jgi:hypothetical protein